MGKNQSPLKIILFLSLAISLPFGSFAQFKVVAYLPTWLNPSVAVTKIDLSRITHLNIAFANPDNTGALIPADGMSDEDVKTVVDACHAKGVKVFMSVGGSGAPGSAYASQLKNATAINNFVNTIQTYVTAHNLDGIDVDIEGDVLDGSTVTGIEYGNFVSALVTSLHNANKELSAALGTWFGQYITATTANQFDWINMMSYDISIPPSDQPGPHAPFTKVMSDYSYWHETKSVPGNKLVVGVPFYGYAWGTYATNTDEMGYCTIVNTYSDAENHDQVGSGSNAIYYNGIPTIKVKTIYAMQYTAGVMIWEITEDCPTSSDKSLLLAIDQTIHSNPTAALDFKSSDDMLVTFPNPVSDKMNVQVNISESCNGTLFISDMNGKILQTLVQGTIASQSRYQCSMTDFNPGVYLLKFDSDRGSCIKKILK